MNYLKIYETKLIYCTVYTPFLHLYLEMISFVLGLFEHMEFLDIIKRLNDRGAMHILTNIWRYLSAEEIGKAMQVSPHWNAAILTDRDAIEKYVEAKEIAMDQNTQSNKHICSRLKNSGPRKALGTLNLIGKFVAFPST